MKTIYKNLASLKLGVFIFFILALCSIIGTLLPQGLTEHELHSAYSPGAAWWIETLGLNDLYRTSWFRLLLLLLSANLIACSIERLPKTLKLLRHQETKLTPNKLLKFSHNAEISTRLPWIEAESKLSAIIGEEFAPLKRLEGSDAFNAFAEKGRWSPLVVYVVHLSVLLVLAGALIGSIFGFKGFMNISEGEASAEVTLSRGDRSLILPFQVRCNEFEVTFYDNRVPKEFRSDLTFIEDGKEVLKQSIRVNDPITFRGVTFYQSSYGSTLKQADVEFSDRSTGKSVRMTLPFRQTMTIPETQDQVQIVEFQQDLSRFGPAVGIVIQKAGQQESSGSWVLVNMPEFHGNRIENYQIKASNLQQIEFTGLQVKKDPGIWMVYFGFTAMLVGIGLAYYVSHRRLWIWAEPGERSTRIILAGRTNKNSLDFENQFNQICERLKSELKSTPAKR